MSEREDMLKDMITQLQSLLAQEKQNNTLPRAVISFENKVEAKKNEPLFGTQKVTLKEMEAMLGIDCKHICQIIEQAEIKKGGPNYKYSDPLFVLYDKLING